MSFAFFTNDLEGVATFWRIFRQDGVTLGFTSHDRDLRFDGVLHHAAPGMIPSAIRLTSSIAPDSAEVEGALSHDSISADDLAIGRFDGAAIQIGAVNWETLERAILYRGSLGAVNQQSGTFNAELRSAKSVLEQDFVPRTSPTCRAQFCGPGCNLSVAQFSYDSVVTHVDLDQNAITVDAASPANFIHGRCRWLEGPRAGLTDAIIAAHSDALVLAEPIPDDTVEGTPIRLIEGCDHTLNTCSSRFGNAVNFQGEPFLPGNDLLARYPLPE